MVKEPSSPGFRESPEEELEQESVRKGFITCPKCGNRIEPDAEKCYCGWKNPLVQEGWI